MTPPEQIQVLDELARMGIVVRDMRTENAALKARVESTADRFDKAVADFSRRLSLAEARGSINAAMGVDPSASGSPAPTRLASLDPVALPAATNPASLPVHGFRVGARAAVVPSIEGALASIRYRVTAASPGLAMLAQVDRSGGDGAQIQVALGDQVPGYGRVIGIQQHGSLWVVQTDKGPDKGAIQ